MVYATLHVAAIDDALLAEKKLMDNKLNAALSQPDTAPSLVAT